MCVRVNDEGVMIISVIKNKCKDCEFWKILNWNYV